MSLNETEGSLPCAQQQSLSVAYIPNTINPAPIFKGSSTLTDQAGRYSKLPPHFFLYYNFL